MSDIYFKSKVRVKTLAFFCSFRFADKNEQEMENTGYFYVNELFFF